MLDKMDGGIGGYFLCGIEWLALTKCRPSDHNNQIINGRSVNCLDILFRQFIFGNNTLIPYALRYIVLLLASG